MALSFAHPWRNFNNGITRAARGSLTQELNAAEARQQAGLPGRAQREI